jgi:hypothetical protein
MSPSSFPFISSRKRKGRFAFIQVVFHSVCIDPLILLEDCAISLSLLSYVAFFGTVSTSLVHRFFWPVIHRCLNTDQKR